jgi:hypothetical protein
MDPDGHRVGRSFWPHPMTQQSDLGWRPRISAERRSGAVGCTFAVSDRIAVTCAHVVAGRPAWWVRPPGHGGIGAPCPVVLDAEHAREIVRHVPAPECRSWQLIKDRSLR